MEAAKDVIFVDEQSQKGKALKEDAGLASSNSGPPAAVTDDQYQMLSIVTQSEESSYSDINDSWLRSILYDEGYILQPDEIPRVQRLLGKIEPNKEYCYKPLLVSIGPYHHGKPELNSMERRKITMVQDYVNGWEIQFDELRMKHMEVARINAWQYYDKGSLTKVFDEEKFTRMMFIDGCFILHFIDCCVHANHTDLKMTNGEIASVKRDLFLLENQLPFKVLQVLMSLRFKEDEGLEMLKDFTKRQGGQRELKVRKMPAHLLEFQYTHFIGDSRGPSYVSLIRRADNSNKPRSANELKAAGFYFKASGTDLLDVSCEAQRTFPAAILKLPPMTIDNSTKTMLLNLLAPTMKLEYSPLTYVSWIHSLVMLKM